MIEVAPTASPTPITWSLEPEPQAKDTTASAYSVAPVGSNSSFSLPSPAANEVCKEESSEVGDGGGPVVEEVDDRSGETVGSV